MSQFSQAEAGQVDAKLTCRGKGKIRDECMSFSRLKNVASQLGGTRPVTGLRLCWKLEEETVSKRLLKEAKAFLTKKSTLKVLKANEWTTLDVVFHKNVYSAPWIEAFVEFVKLGVKFVNIICTWEVGSWDFRQAMKCLYEDGLGEEIRRPPLVLCLCGENSIQAGVILRQLKRLFRKRTWHVEVVSMNIDELFEAEVPKSLKEILGDYTPHQKFLIDTSSEDTTLRLNEACAKLFLDALSSRPYCTFGYVTLEFSETVPDIFFKAKYPQELVFMDLNIDQLTQLGKNAWQLSEIRTVPNQYRAGFVYKKEFKKQISVFTKRELIEKVLLEQDCVIAKVVDFKVGLRRIFKLKSLEKVADLIIHPEQETGELGLNDDIAWVSTVETLPDTMSALKEIISAGNAPHVRSLLIKVRKELITEPIRLQVAEFRELALEHQIKLSLGLGDELAENDLFQTEFSLNTILSAKIRAAVESGKLIEYSRPKLVVLGPTQSGKTTMIRALLGKDLDQELVPTEVGENKWMLKIPGRGRGEENNWIVTAVDDANGMTTEIDDVQANINHMNASYIFKSNVALNSRRMQKLKPAENLQVAKPQLKQKKKKKNTLFTGVPRRIYGHSKLSVWDTSGSNSILTDHIMSQGTVYILTLSIPDYLDDDLNIHTDKFKGDLDEWISYISVYADSSKLLVIGTSSSQASEECIKNFSEIVKNEVGDQISLVTNKVREPEMAFFPVENENINTVDHSIVTIRRSIENCLPWLVEEVPVSWLSFMDLFFQSEKVLMSISEVEEAARANNLATEKVPAIISRYNRMGSILAIHNIGVETSYSDFIVLKPSDFIAAVTAIIHKAEETREAEKPCLVISVEQLLEVVQKNFASDETCDRFLQFCEDALLICPWPSAELNTQSYLIPSQTRQVIDEPAPSNEWSLFLVWQDAAPKCFFHHLVALVIAEAVNLGSVISPVIYENYAHFNIRGLQFSLWKHSNEVEIRFSRRFSRCFGSLALGFEGFAEEFGKRGFEVPVLVVESSSKRFRGKSEKYRAKWMLVSQKLFSDAQSDKEDFVPAFGVEYNLNITSFDEFEMLQPTIPISETMDLNYDICILHDFGVPNIMSKSVGNIEAQFPEQQLVLEMADKLENSLTKLSPPLSVWVDRVVFNGFKVSFADKIMKNCEIVVILLTKSLLRQLENKTSSASVHLHAAVGDGVTKIVALALEEELVEKQSWGDSLLAYELAGNLYTTLTDISKGGASEKAAFIEKAVNGRRGNIAFNEAYGNPS